MKVGQQNLKVWVEFGQHLAAGSAGGGGFLGVGRYRYLGKLPAPGSHCGAYRIPLGTDGQTIADVLDIASSENPPILPEQSHPNMKF